MPDHPEQRNIKGIQGFMIPVHLPEIIVTPAKQRHRDQTRILPEVIGVADRVMIQAPHPGVTPALHQAVLHQEAVAEVQEEVGDRKK